MKEIPLTQGKVALVDDRDYDALMSLGPWCAYKSRHTWYAVRAFRDRNGKLCQWGMHAVLLGTRGTKIVVDHCNGNGLDNRRANLRRATREQNARNTTKPIRGASRFHGVSLTRQRKNWRAQIRIDGKRVHLGEFKTEELAARAYDEASRKHHGEFARLNFPTGAIAHKCP